MIKKESRNSMRISRHERIRKTMMGTSAIPRLCVFRSNKGIYAQIIDDETRTTLCSASSLDKSLKIKNGSELVRDMISVRVGTTGYMYDKVSGELFGNVGSGSFGLGNDITT